jgi:hypothetical protein
MKSKSFRLLFLAAGLALLIGCESNTDYGEIANLHDSYTYRHPSSGGFYDPWYGGSGAYVGSRGYGGASVGIGISVPVN